MTELNLVSESATKRTILRNQWRDMLLNKLMHKYIEVIADKWSGRNGDWQTYRITVVNVLDDVSGHVCNPEINVTSSDGENYTILSSTPIKFL